MKTYKAGELREDMLVVPVHMLEGFLLVPVEPTDGCRVEAGFEVIDRKHIPTVTIKMPPISAEDYKGWDRRDKVAQAIRAMLAAAPKGDSHE